MNMRNLGRTGLKVAPLCLGGNVFGWTADEPTSFAVLDAYVEAGGNFIDSADGYSRWAPGHKGGESETVLGKWFRERGKRHEVVLGTKVGSPMGTGPNDKGLSRQHIMEAVEASLRRLQTDYIDLYHAHFEDPETPLDETVRAFDDLVRQGKARYLAVSNHSSWKVLKSLWESDRRGLARFEAIQPKYNLVSREDYERDLEPMCLDQQLGVITYSSLASGFLTGKYRRGQDLPAGPRARQVQGGYMTDRGFAILDALDRVCARSNATPAQVSLAWIMARPGVTAPIASATTVEQMKELAGAAEMRLDPESIQELDEASAWRQ